jgi:antitoxin component of MazEF toxin-antitoxin module
MREEVITIITAYKSGDSLVVTIPKHLEKRGLVKSHQRFFVKIDEYGRIIYEPVEPRRLSDATNSERLGWNFTG